MIKLMANCELCVDEAIHQKTEMLKDMPDNQKKTQDIHKAINEALDMAHKPCVVIPCHEAIDAQHFICKDHLNRMVEEVMVYEYLYYKDKNG